MIVWEDLTTDQTRYVLQNVTNPLAVFFDVPGARDLAEARLGDPAAWPPPAEVVVVHNALPEGYDPDKLQAVVQDAKADADSNSTKAVLAEMRKQNPGMK